MDVPVTWQPLADDWASEKSRINTNISNQYLIKSIIQSMQHVHTYWANCANEIERIAQERNNIIMKLIVRMMQAANYSINRMHNSFDHSIIPHAAHSTMILCISLRLNTILCKYRIATNNNKQQQTTTTTTGNGTHLGVELAQKGNAHIQLQSNRHTHCTARRDISIYSHTIPSIIQMW